jgi:hypothetical protein
MISIDTSFLLSIPAISGEIATFNANVNIRFSAFLHEHCFISWKQLGKKNQGCATALSGCPILFLFQESGLLLSFSLARDLRTHNKHGNNNRYSNFLHQ